MVTQSIKRTPLFTVAKAFNGRVLLIFVMVCLVAALASSCATGSCRRESAHAVVERENNLSHWGQAVNPDGDCKFFVAQDTLLIHVPGLPHPHDLAAELDRVNAPRVLRQVNGDFTIQVRVDGRFEPEEESTQENRFGYNGAGLVVMANPQNVVTLARAVLQRPGEAPVPYANFEIRINGHLQRIGMTGDHPLPKTGPVFLRLQRRSSKLIGAVSLDGDHWDELGSKKIPNNWRKKLQAGVIAISTSTEEFNPRFSEFKISK